MKEEDLIHKFENKIVTRAIPKQFTFPFCYTPNMLAKEACELIKAVVAGNPCWSKDIARGKMLGVLVVEETCGLKKEIEFLAAFSGTLCGKSTLPYFVPPVFDLHDPNCHFQKEEKRISLLNKEIEVLEHDDELQAARLALQEIQDTSAKEIEQAILRMKEAKNARDTERGKLTSSDSVLDEEAFIRESQFLKAEVRRCKQYWKERISSAQKRMSEIEAKIEEKKTERKTRSAALQQWLFEHFLFMNARGETASLLDIFGKQTPPAGAGECCAPKLLQYAYTHHLRPLCMAEFWMGESPRQEIRKEGSFYPACQAKCKPILAWMLQGLDVERNPMIASYEKICRQMEIVYEDRQIVVIHKPSGMLSVPGKDGLPSVQSEIARMYPQAEGPIIVHRLDMDTSGLMVVALTENAYLELQKQFARHTIRKRYTAILEKPLPVGQEGVIDLPLCSNPEDRPRQMVNQEYGKRAITQYRVRGLQDQHAILSLWPETGRTHQLRMHMAHPEGLNNPILGDRLYGTSADRLHLYADELEFEHPVTHQKMQFQLHIIPEELP